MGCAAKADGGLEDTIRDLAQIMPPSVRAVLVAQYDMSQTVIMLLLIAVKKEKEGAYMCQGYDTSLHVYL